MSDTESTVNASGLAEDLFRWNTPTDPYFVINGRTGDDPDGDPYEPIIRAVLDPLIGRIQEFDPSDNYHRGDIYEPDYYAALDRVVRLLRGEIQTWTDPAPTAPPA